MHLARWFLPCLLPVLAACGGGSEDGGGTVGAKDPLGPPTPTTTYVFQYQGVNGKTDTQVAGYNGTKDFGGTPFDVFQVHPDKPDGMEHGMEAYVVIKPGDTVSFAGGKLFWANSGMQPPEQPFVSGTVEPPLSGSLNPPLGVTQSVPVKGTLYIGDPTDPANAQAVDTTVTYTLVDDDASVATSLGTVHGCKHVQGETTVMGITVHPEVWYHPQMGLVKFHVDYPAPDGIGMDLAEIRDMGNAKEGQGTIKAVKVLTPDARDFRLDTYDVNGQFDADKDKHAKMLLEIRWADDEQAKTAAVPQFLGNDVEFGTVWGIYPFQMVESPVSLFHPEENGKGFTFWYGYADEAAKNEPGSNGIPYIIQVRPGDAMTGAVRATARIRYHVIALP